MREIERIAIHHSASAPGVLSWDDVRRIHTDERGWNDIGYHFGVWVQGEDSVLAVGRPLETAGAHVRRHNAKTIGICFEGNFENAHPTQAQIHMGAAVATELCRNFGLDPLATIVAHRDFYGAATVCPGKWFPINTLRGMVADRMREAA